MTTAETGPQHRLAARSRIGEPLGPRARQVLDAAQRVVDRDGADKLTLRAVAREAGLATSVVLYHFGTMDKLEALLLDSLWHDIDVDFLATIESLPDDAGSRIDALVNFHASIAESPQRYLRYFEMVSAVVHKPDTQVEIAQIYRGYRTDLNVPLLTHPERTSEETDALAALVLAVAEGLPFLRLVDGDGSPQPQDFDTLRALLTTQLHARGADRTPLSSDLASRTGEADGASGLPESGGRHPTAQRLLDAGHSILGTSGLRGLSLENLARASGEARPAVGYHFGSKDKFVDALALDVVRCWHSRLAAPDTWDALVPDYPSGKLLETLRPPTSELVQVFPVVHRQPAVRTATAEAIHAGRAAIAGTLGSRTEHGIADLALAAVVGLTLQAMYDPDGFDAAPAVAQLATLLS